jgi:hypothetical protein
MSAKLVKKDRNLLFNQKKLVNFAENLNLKYLKLKQ